MDVTHHLFCPRDFCPSLDLAPGLMALMTQCIVWLPYFFALVEVTAGVTTSYSGYLVDSYCYAQLRNGFRALDSTDVIAAPETHTTHCLRDPKQCVSGGYYLAYNRGDSASPSYQPAFMFDDTGNANAIALLRTVPVGDPNDNAPGYWTVTATGESNGDGVLRGATLVRCTDSGSCDGNCSGSCDTLTTGIDLEVNVDALLWAHVICMCLSWGLLLPLGVLWARHLRNNPRKVAGHPIWFQGHRAIQLLGLSLQLAGLGCVLALKSRHLHTAHEILGLAVIFLGTLQPVNALIRHSPCVGHPSEGQPKSTGRKIWEAVHKGLGVLAVILGISNIILGIIYASDYLYDDALIITASVLAGTSLGVLLIAAIVLEVRRRRQRSLEDTDLDAEFDVDAGPSFQDAATKPSEMHDSLDRTVL